MAEPAKVNSIFDVKTWQQLSSLVDGQDVSFLDGLLQSYLETAAEHIETLRNDKADIAALRRAAHTLFGSSLSIGIPSIATISRKLELELGRIPVYDLADRIAKIERQLERVRQSYPQQLETIRSTKT
ncbi:MAG TPA: Hpt domain-containing protein [Polyangiaceae bacterium]|nr:Hpt domain-containing protein [Polyangiaceae bacterium]